MTLGQQISRSTKIVLTVLGLSNPYPKVDIKDIQIVKKQNTFYTTFTTENLINEDIRTVISSGINIQINYSIKSKANNKLLYNSTQSDLISFSGNQWFLNESAYSNFSSLTDQLKTKKLMILSSTNSASYGNIQTSIEIIIRTQDYADLTELWGNQPRIILKYKY